MSCPACGQENPAGNRFCGGCGAALARTCPACAQANPSDHRFCGACGAGLQMRPQQVTEKERPLRDVLAYTAANHDTLLFRSENPFDFGTYTGDEREVAARLYAHAPEYLQDEAGRWWITSCGWPHELCQPAIPGSVAIRELMWR